MKVSASTRNKVEERAEKLCEYCQSPLEFSSDPFSVEHISPISKGGTDDLGNLALACQGCNGHKSTKTEAFDAISQTTATFYNPRKDMWDEHFVWSEDFAEIIGKTAKGRVTIKVLKLNRQRVMNLRRVLILAGEHPPNIEK
ncbi:MAG: HNH endonuclease [Acidobacteriota bacterium]|nr:HNH endonuclease [Acidobacteriota bacterium]